MYMYIWIDVQKFCVCARAECLHQCLAHAMLLSYRSLPHSVLKSDWFKLISQFWSRSAPWLLRLFVFAPLLAWNSLISSCPHDPGQVTTFGVPWVTLSPSGGMQLPSAHHDSMYSFLICCHQWLWAPWGQGLYFIALYPASSTVSQLQQCYINICWTNANNQNDL